MWSSMKNKSIKGEGDLTKASNIHIEDETVIPNADAEAVTKRRFTDRYFLMLHIASYVCMVPLINYCMKYGALERLTSGYDSCRNICGQQNVMEDEKKKSWCDGLDMRYRPYLLIFRPDGINHYNATRLYERHNDVVVPIELKDNVQRVCVVNCTRVYKDYYQYKDTNRCIVKKTNTVQDIFFGKSGLPYFFLEVAEDVATGRYELIYLAGASLGYAIIVMLLFGLRKEMLVWFVLIGLTLACLIGTIYVWAMFCYWHKIVGRHGYLVPELELRRCRTYLTFAIIGTFLTICASVIMFIMRSRIEFIIRLFKETGKAITAVPLLLLQPLVTTVFVSAVVATWLYFFLWIESSGHDIELYDDFYEYQKDFWIYFARWYNVFVAMWSIQFILGCQHIIVAAAVSVWYFANDKDILGTPIFYGLYNLLRYHIGSVSCGSFGILLTEVLNNCLNILQKLNNYDGNFVIYLQRLCRCCNFVFEKFTRNLTRTAYIAIALYGDSFYQAGQNACKSLTFNAFRVGNIDSAGDFALFLGKVFVSITTMLTAIALLQEKEDVQHAWVLILFSGMFGYLVSHCFLSVYEMTMDTIFLCFCEDCQHNDGVAQPYFMTHDLLKFVINAKSTKDGLDLENYMDYVHQD